jgi:hypothetical protein
MMCAGTLCLKGDAASYNVAVHYMPRPCTVVYNADAGVAGPAGCREPRHRMPFNSKNEG